MASAATPLRAVGVGPGAKVDRYELLCHLARGGMADVWLARLHSKPEFEKLFAIKTILPGEAENALFRDMFLDEARLVSRIDHPNVVRVSDVGEHAGLPYLVMELIEGEPLDKIARDLARAGKAVPVEIALRVVTDACNGLAAAHALRDATGATLNVVHRDVSPQNILVTTAGHSKVIDFGIAKARDRAVGKTECGMLKGKISYMPMEQAHGQEVDARADTWALGAVLYFLFAGRPPHKADTQLAILKAAMSAAPIEPLPDTVAAPVRALVAKALCHDIQGRFQTAAEMAAALEDVIRELDGVASYTDVGSFVEKAMGERLAARRNLVSKLLSESTNRESARLAAAIPVELDTDARGSSPSWGPLSRSGARAVVRPATRRWARGAAALVAALAIAGIGTITIAGRTPARPRAVDVPPRAPTTQPVEPPLVVVPTTVVASAAASDAAPAPPKPIVTAVTAVRLPPKLPKAPMRNLDDEKGF